LLTFLSISYAQIFETGQTLRSGKASIGINPALFSDSGVNDFAFYVHGGYGLMRTMDIGLKLGFGGDDTYFGANLEWMLRGKSPSISFATGVHSYGDIGLDGTLNFSFPINRMVIFYSGLDMDMVFGEKIDDGEEKSDIYFPTWIFLGIEIGFRRNVNIILEAEIGLGDRSPNIIGGGFNFYF
jgi:hypothetical protein